MSASLSVLVLCGGVSTEHDISILSARYAVTELSKKHQVSVCYITQEGRWLLLHSLEQFQDGHPEDWLSVQKPQWLQFIPGQVNPIVRVPEGGELLIDCVFSLLHGTNGEDGAMQGLLEVLNLPYVGPNVSAAAICMDKDFTKRLLAYSGIPVVPWQCVTRAEKDQVDYEAIKTTLGPVCFVKANSLGSSVGVERVTNAVEFERALESAFTYDNVVLIEKAITGREIECSVLGNQDAVVSLPGEVVNHKGFYSYDAKYVDVAASTVKTPACLTEQAVAAVRALAQKAYQCVRCQGMARVDTFLADDGQWYINEINTIPGFTQISLYPKNWAVSGLSGEMLFDRLLSLALTAYQEKQLLCREYQLVEKQPQLADNTMIEDAK